MNKIPLSDIVSEFELTLVGNDKAYIEGPGSLLKQSDYLIYWLKDIKYLNRIPKGSIIIGNDDFSKIEPQKGINYLITRRKPRLVYAKVLQRYFMNHGLVISENQADHLTNREDLVIADNVYIAKDVKIGKGTIIHPNVVIHNGTKIGKNCVIKANTTIGTEGLGYEKDDNGELVKFPQLGGVSIGDEVEIGPSSTVRRGALDDTIVGKGVKIGSFCNIGHNCEIGDYSILTCQCVTGGSSVLGRSVFMGIQSNTRNGVRVGNDCVIGSGAVVVKDVLDGLTVIGSPAISMSEYKNWSKIRKEIIESERDEKED